MGLTPEEEAELNSLSDGLTDEEMGELQSYAGGGASPTPTPTPLPAYQPEPDNDLLHKLEPDAMGKLDNFAVNDDGTPASPFQLLGRVAGEAIKTPAAIAAGMIAPQALGFTRALPYVAPLLETAASTIGFHTVENGIDAATGLKSPDQAMDDLTKNVVPGLNVETALNYGIPAVAQGVKFLGGLARDHLYDPEQSLINAAGASKADRVLPTTSGEVPVQTDLNTLMKDGVDLASPEVAGAAHPTMAAREILGKQVEAAGAQLAEVGKQVPPINVMDVIGRVRKAIGSLGGEQAALAEKMLSKDEGALFAQSTSEFGSGPAKIDFGTVRNMRIGQDAKAYWDVPGDPSMKADVARALRDTYASVLEEMVPAGLRPQYLQANARFHAAKTIFDDLEKGALESQLGRNNVPGAEAAVGVVQPGKSLMKRTVETVAGPTSTDALLRRAGGEAPIQRAGDFFDSALPGSMSQKAVGIDALTSLGRDNNKPTNILNPILPTPKERDGTYLSRDISAQSMDTVGEAIGSVEPNEQIKQQMAIGAMRAFATKDQRKIAVFLTQLHRRYPDLPFQRGPITGKDSEWVIDGKHYIVDPADQAWWQGQIDNSDLPSDEKAWRVNGLGRDGMIIPMDAKALQLPEKTSDPTKAQEAQTQNFLARNPMSGRSENAYGSRKEQPEGF